MCIYICMLRFQTLWLRLLLHCTPVSLVQREIVEEWLLASGMKRPSGEHMYMYVHIYMKCHMYIYHTYMAEQKTCTNIACFCETKQFTQRGCPHVQPILPLLSQRHLTFYTCGNYLPHMLKVTHLTYVRMTKQITVNALQQLSFKLETHTT